MTPRQLAREWRTGDALQRACIEEQITRERIGHMFTRRDGVLRVRCDWAQITASGGGSYMPAHERRFREDVARNGAGIGFAVETRTGLIHMNEDLAA